MEIKIIIKGAAESSSLLTIVKLAVNFLKKSNISYFIKILIHSIKFY